MKYRPRDPWWLNRTVDCSNCKGFTTLDSLLDEQEFEKVSGATGIFGESYRFLCPGCGAMLRFNQFHDNQWVRAKQRGARVFDDAGNEVFSP